MMHSHDFSINICHELPYVSEPEPIHEIHSVDEIQEFHDIDHLPNKSLFVIGQNKFLNQINFITLGIQYQIKMMFDFVFALALVTLLSPIIILTMAIIYFQDFHYPFFKTARIGKDSKPFTIFKFRSMKPQSDVIFIQNSQGLYVNKNDDRITQFGKIIRKLSIDELPQLFNVLQGKMSIIGPRPLAQEEFDLVNRMGIRHRVKPGLTGLWQVTGRINGIRLACDVEAIDNFYIENWNLWLDIRIIVKTIPVVLFCRGS